MRPPSTHVPRGSLWDCPLLGKEGTIRIADQEWLKRVYQRIINKFESLEKIFEFV